MKRIFQFMCLLLACTDASYAQTSTGSIQGTVFTNDNKPAAASFIPLWPGKYVIEAQEFSRTPGELNGNKYTTFWQGATYSFEIGK